MRCDSACGRTQFLYRARRIRRCDPGSGKQYRSGSTAGFPALSGNSADRTVAVSDKLTYPVSTPAGILFPMSKDRASSSYVMLSLGLSGLTFLGVTWLVTHVGRGLPVLNAWGRNALLLYLLHGVLIGLFALPQAAWWYVNATTWLVALQTLLLVGTLSWIGLALDRRRLYFSL